MGGARGRGFSLIELLVVLAIAALLAAVIPPLLTNAVARGEVTSAVRYLAAGLRATRDEAIRTRAETVLLLDVKHRSYRLDDREKILRLPDDAALSLVTAESELQQEHAGGIRFFPDGSSTGGRIRLAWREMEYRIDVNWLTGRVSIKP